QVIGSNAAAWPSHAATSSTSRTPSCHILASTAGTSTYTKIPARMGQSPFFQTLRHIIVTLCAVSFLLWAGAVVFSGVFSRAQMRQRDRYSGWNATEIADAMVPLQSHSIVSTLIS